MISDEDLDSEVASGTISREAEAELRGHVADKAVTPAVDEENFRLVSSFNDIFLVIAGSLLLIMTTGTRCSRSILRACGDA